MFVKLLYIIFSIRESYFFNSCFLRAFIRREDELCFTISIEALIWFSPFKSLCAALVYWTNLVFLTWVKISLVIIHLWFFLKKNLLLFHVYECVPAWKCVRYVHIWCLQRPEEGLPFPGSGVTDACEPTFRCWETGSFVRAESDQPATQPSAQPYICDSEYIHKNIIVRILLMLTRKKCSTDLCVCLSVSTLHVFMYMCVNASMCVHMCVCERVCVHVFYVLTSWYQSKTHFGEWTWHFIFSSICGTFLGVVWFFFFFF